MAAHRSALWSRAALLLPLLCLALLTTACGRKDRFKVLDRAPNEPPIPVRAIVTDFDDSRPVGFKVNSWVSYIPLSPFGSYYYERHDDVFTGATKKFPMLVAEELADRLKQAEVFEEVRYVPRGQLPAPGQYDVLVTGNLNRIRSRGGISRYGLSIFGDLIWNLGVPYVSRRWEIDIDYQLLNAYTGEEIVKANSGEYTTGRRLYGQYSGRARTTDLRNKIDPALDPFIAAVWDKAPDAKTNYWANLQSEGSRLLASQAREQETIRRGSPPVFSFLSPSQGARVRESSVAIRWSVSAPGGLKVAQLVVNNQPVNLGLNPNDLALEETAPKTIPAQDVTVPLRMGRNQLQALVADHRGNQTRADFEVIRLPPALTPEKRYALFLTDSSGARGAEEVRRVFTDPLLGQFEDRNISAVAPSTLTRSEVERALRDFGGRPLAGELAVIYLSTKGNWNNLTIGDGSLTLADFFSIASQSLATKEVVVLADIDWSGQGTSEEVGDRVNVPGGWAFLISQSRGGRSVQDSGRPLFAQAIVDAMEGRSTSASRLTVERFLDGVISGMERRAGGNVRPQVYGDFNRSNTMAERD